MTATAFLAYVGATLVVARDFRWRAPVTLLGLSASIPPFGSALFEVRADRRGLAVLSGEAGDAQIPATSPRGEG